MQITQEQLSQILPDNAYIENWCEALNKILPDYDINSVNRIAAFLGETYVESAGYTALHENLNYTAQSLCRVWPSHFTPDIADQYAHNPERIANRAYAGRMGNGDEASGDGWRFCGRGLIQVTGRSNYQAFADSLQMNIDDVPAFLATFEGAIQSATAFWETNNLNQFADSWNIQKLSIKINGGELGLPERIAQCNHALQVLNT